MLHLSFKILKVHLDLDRTTHAYNLQRSFVLALSVRLNCLPKERLRDICAISSCKSCRPLYIVPSRSTYARNLDAILFRTPHLFGTTHRFPSLNPPTTSEFRIERVDRHETECTADVVHQRPSEAFIGRGIFKKAKFAATNNQLSFYNG